MGLGEARVVYTDPPMENPLEWYEQRGRLNPFSPYIERNVGLSHYRFRDVVGAPASFRRTEFYQRFAKVEGWDKGLSLMFWDGSDMRGMFSLYRGSKQRDFSDAEVEAALDIGRHIEIAIARVQQLDLERSLRGSLEAFVRTMPAPLLVLDWALKPVFSNSAAYESAALWNFGRERARRYNPRDCFRLPGQILNALQDLQAEVQQINPKLMGERLPADMTVRHAREHRLSVQIRTARTSRSSLARPVFLLLFREAIEVDSHTADQQQREQLRARAMQELTPSERKVADLVCRGYRNDRIATELNKSILTVKSQLNSIFQKLGFKSRAELVVCLK
jgi:DNA-binding CsgD family transcriptional regulator